ncbi:indole-3-glycerol phosphate synthase TrpC [Acidisoma sp.]|uniref:indole-3-glycerol phosphate synthase TrpC n=1 Tax=Acidisoma sp. TaxID=1872115 RepID=UPI003B007EFD
MNSQVPDLLVKICDDTRADVARRRASMPMEMLKQKIAGQTKPRGFGRTLMDHVNLHRVALIAEIKKASPSGGLIRPDFNPPALASAYRDGGATCLSVLTDRTWFQGEPAHLMAARAAVPLPVLRKDFILDPWQVYESRAMGADCILLILAALSDDQARELEALARALDMDVLAEVHDEDELRRALGLETPLIGINNRNLKTLKIDLQTAVDLAPQVPPERFLIAESGIQNAGDVRRLVEAGLQCYLVGESLMRQTDVAQAVRDLIGPERTADAA